MEITPTTAIIVISFLSLAVLILGFTTVNLLKKNEKAEDILLGYLDYLDISYILLKYPLVFHFYALS